LSEWHKLEFHMRIKYFLAASASLLAVTVSATAQTAGATDPVLYWNTVLLNTIRTSALPPPKASRLMAMVNAAVFDAVNTAGGSAYKNYITPGISGANSDVTAAASAAAYRVLLDQLPAQQGALDTAYASIMSGVPTSAARDNGLALGQVSASDILAARAKDGSTITVTYTPGTQPGDWQPTAPANAAALLPNWGNVTPFTMTSGSQFRPDGPPALDSAAYTAAFNEVKSLGSATSTTRTADQTAIAKYWADGGGTATPPGHWLSIASDISKQQGLTTLENARLFAMLSTAAADAGITAWDAKYTENFWRPITGIRNAELDGNPDTVGDATWTPLLTTPPFPAYISGHSTFSSAAAEILSLFFSGKTFNFCSAQELNPSISRCWSSFSEAAAEAGMSRIYGGIHWQFDNADGLLAGKNIGQNIYNNFFGVPEPGSLATLAIGIGAAFGIARRRKRSVR
jgi:membrane-associated phospholipid phosphatase